MVKWLLVGLLVPAAHVVYNGRVMLEVVDDSVVTNAYPILILSSQLYAGESAVLDLS